MSLRLTKFQKQLCNALQDGLPICQRPFARIAKDLNCDERTILQQTGELKDAGVIRRISALMDYRSLGRVSTLVTAHIPQEDLPEVTLAVNCLEGVSHNYLREHFYNLWFTLQAQNAEHIDAVLSNLSHRFGIDFHSLPVERSFKLDVRFDAVRTERRSSSDLCAPTGRVHSVAPVELDVNEKVMLSRLQDDVAIASEPFAFLCSAEQEPHDVLKVIRELIDKGVIRRVAAVVDHRRLGFVANVLFVSEVAQDRIVLVGEKLACLGAVSHCYQRRTFENWPYNLFAMMHGRSMDQVQHAMNTFVEAERIDSFELLPTTAELKKQPVGYRLD